MIFGPVPLSNGWENAVPVLPEYYPMPPYSFITRLPDIFAISHHDWLKRTEAYSQTWVEWKEAS